MFMEILETSWFWLAIGGIGLVTLFIILGFMFYKVADANRALVITGWRCKEAIVKISGGAIVIPILQKAKFFPLDIMTIVETGDEVRTNNAVPIVIKWTAQASVKTTDGIGEGDASLVKTIRLFIDKGSNGMMESVKNTIQANVRETIAAMTPEAVLTDKKDFVEKIMAATRPDLNKIGIELSTLNINDVCDKIGYYDNMAEAQIQEKRRDAETARAEADKTIRERKAEAVQAAREKELAAELIVAEKQRNNDVRKAEFKVETETADANAEIAKDIQTQTRYVEFNEQRGVAEAKEKERENITAAKQNEIAETEAKRAVIQAEGIANANAITQKIGAEAAASVAKTSASGKAEAAKIEAEGKAKSVKLEAKVKQRLLNLKRMRRKKRSLKQVPLKRMLFAPKVWRKLTLLGRKVLLKLRRREHWLMLVLQTKGLTLRSRNWKSNLRCVLRLPLMLLRSCRT